MSAASDMLETYQVLMSSLVTEKSTFQKASLNQFSFQVPVAATKTLIRKAVQDAFGVKVMSVNTQRHKERAARFRFHRGFTAEWKKAIVTVDKQQTLPV